MESIVGPEHGTPEWWQMVIRGVFTLVYCTILIRILCRRAFGMQSHLDVALAVLLGSILSRGIIGQVPFFGVLATAAAMAVCYWLLIHITQRFPSVGWFMKGTPIALVKNGHIDERAMRSGGISRADLDEAIRQVQLDDINLVATAILERSGRISIVPK